MSRKFYIHDRTRGYVGNSMVWWKRGHHGYTCDLREAHVFDELEQARARITELEARLAVRDVTQGGSNDE